MGIFVLDKVLLDRIVEVREYAENNQYLYNDWVNDGCPASPTKIQADSHKIFAKVDGLYSYKFVYTIEESFSKGGGLVKLRRVSASDLITRIPPHPSIMKMVMELLGFKKNLEENLKDGNVFYDPESRSIINVTELYE